jgi:hypothetical protein
LCVKKDSKVEKTNIGPPKKPKYNPINIPKTIQEIKFELLRDIFSEKSEKITATIRHAIVLKITTFKATDMSSVLQ